MGDLLQFPGADAPRDFAAAEDDVVDQAALIVRLDGLLDRWMVVGEERKRRGTKVDFDIVSDLLRAER